MHVTPDHTISRFCVAGISYKKADAHIRGLFALDPKAVELAMAKASHQNIRSVFVVSTCNRTEIYGYAHHPEVLAKLLVDCSRGNTADLKAYGYVYNGRPAMHHLFRMASGLDSQIIGDYEIQSQLKQAVAVARQYEKIGPIMDRTLNFVFQASKKIRTNTLLSSGTVSVSYAAIEWLQHKMGSQQHKTLVIGTGKFGTTVCRNLQEYMPNCQLTLCNRTNSKAQAQAKKLNAEYLPYEALLQQLNHFDVVVVTTAAPNPILLKEHFEPGKNRLVIDLSVPENVAADVAELAASTLVNVDDISKIMEATIARRMEEVPKAEKILHGFESEFYEWLYAWRHTRAISKMKERLIDIGKDKLAQTIAAQEDLVPAGAEIDNVVSDTLSCLAKNLKHKSEKGCQFIEAYQHFLNHPALVAQSV